jgi:hypothetical protein
MKALPFSHFSIAVCLIVLFASCNKTNKQGRYVPKDAAIVMVSNGKSLSSKLSWDDIKQDSLLQEIYSSGSTPASLKSILNNPDSSGIDIKSDLIFFVEKDSSGGYLALEGTLKDANLFKSFNQQITNGGSESDKDDVSYISHYPSCVGWNKEKFIYVFDAPSLNKLAFSSPISNESTDIHSGRDIGATCKSLFDLAENNSLAKNEKFTKLLKETGDIHFWANTETFYSGASSGLFSMFNFDQLYKENISTGVLNFDNGKINLSFKNYLSDKFLDLYKKYKGDKINQEMLKRIPGNNIQGAIAISFNPELIKEILIETNADGIINMGLSQMKLTVTDFVNAFKGDFVLGLSDLKMKTDSVFGVAVPKPDYNFIFAATIDDKDALNKIINAYKKISQNGSTDENSKKYFADTSNATYYVLSNTQENAGKYLNGNSSGNFDFIDKINDQPFGFYFNIHSLLKECEGLATKDSSSKKVFDAALNFWNNISIKGGSVDNGTITYSMEINLVDTATNSLKQLNQYISTIGTAVKEKKDKEAIERAKMDAEMGTDKNFFPPPQMKATN